MASVFLSDADWKGHQWGELNARRVHLKSGDSVLQRYCVRCARAFVMFESSGECYAVYASAFSFQRLNDEVTQRWMNEACQGRHTEADDKDRAEKIIAHLPVGTWDSCDAPARNNRAQRAG